MVQRLGKLEQFKLLNTSRLNPKYIPTTTEYSLKNLRLFLTQFDVIYIKHATSGQGRGVFKITKGQNQFHSLNGYSMQGKPINQKLTIEQIHKLLHPFESFGRLNPYIIQEGIQSVTKTGQPFSIRVHVQFVSGEWKVGGILANFNSERLDNNGIVNRRRGSKILPIQRLLKHYLRLNPKEERELLEKINDVSIEASEIIANKYPGREFGIDVGVDTNLNPIIFEVNKNAGIAGFYLIDPKLWQEIVQNRKSL
ncbi:YheC/YheD family protein [Neobacillus vireti]|uniref:ATP-grasp domain-containing protein n=1 Tax=Neobacillus vireti LMG 21834 TaxID=1131730 RepID=A0AB94IGM4_9BACI|nr:YheC/YheD family protein [Neobacillus vireti]ETI66262.1 hypothetical protein BAVI_23563 [Neobacillus vireti LMG 21834]KLT18087.1 hypothetical protein AA980_10460 [Neobacillus vireti]